MFRRKIEDNNLLLVVVGGVKEVLLSLLSVATTASIASWKPLDQPKVQKVPFSKN